MRTLTELLILLGLAIFIIFYRKSQNGEEIKNPLELVGDVYNKYAPYSFKVVREKAKDLGQEYNTRQYITQIILLGGFAALIGYFYFYSIIWAAIYGAIAIAFVPYLAYLRCQRVYSEFIFEQIQTYTTNVIMEFNTTQSFVKSLEGVRDSGIIEDPVLSDIKKMIDMSYKNGTIDESIEYFNSKYPFYMVKNMHQLFLQITNEGSRDSGDSLENMSLDIDMLVESVYRDRIDRAGFHKKFLQFGIILYLMVMLVQFLLGIESYIAMLDDPLTQVLLHGIVIVNTYFLLSGEKYYNEDVGAE